MPPRGTPEGAANSEGSVNSDGKKQIKTIEKKKKMLRIALALLEEGSGATQPTDATGKTLPVRLAQLSMCDEDSYVTTRQSIYHNSRDGPLMRLFHRRRSNTQSNT